jgi:hypothetical protein
MPPQNVGATFKRVMDISFAGDKDIFIVVYLDDMTVYSKSNDQHLKHLKWVFLKSRRYALSLNPKKCFFTMNDRKLLGYIVSKYGFNIDPERVEVIHTINFPRQK